MSINDINDLWRFLVSTKPVIEPFINEMEEDIMAEKVYKTMKSVGAFSLVTGILLIVGGIAAGVAVIINGAKLLHAKSDLTF